MSSRKRSSSELDPEDGTQPAEFQSDDINTVNPPPLESESKSAEPEAKSDSPPARPVYDPNRDLIGLDKYFGCNIYKAPTLDQLTIKCTHGNQYVSRYINIDNTNPLRQAFKGTPFKSLVIQTPFCVTKLLQKAPLGSLAKQVLDPDEVVAKPVKKAKKGDKKEDDEEDGNLMPNVGFIATDEAYSENKTEDGKDLAMTEFFSEGGHYWETLKSVARALAIDTSQFYILNESIKKEIINNKKIKDYEVTLDMKIDAIHWMLWKNAIGQRRAPSVDKFIGLSRRMLIKVRKTPWPNAPSVPIKRKKVSEEWKAKTDPRLVALMVDEDDPTLFGMEYSNYKMYQCTSAEELKKHPDRDPVTVLTPDQYNEKCNEGDLQSTIFRIELVEKEKGTSLTPRLRPELVIRLGTKRAFQPGGATTASFAFGGAS